MEYWHTHDLFMSLRAAAAITKTIKIGSSICLMIERDPITLANEVASVAAGTLKRWRTTGLASKTVSR